MTKPHQIRKKAQDFAKKRQWDKAINEYIQLAEIEANNPNVFNELGDLHLKIGNKGEAFKAFHCAIDAYSGMGLLNNAVAVCKKLIRLSPSDSAVYGKLARLRNQQGIKKEAASYALSFLELIAGDATADPEGVKSDLIELAPEMGHATEVLERIAEYLLAQQFASDAGAVLERLAHEYVSRGMSAEAEKTAKRMDEIGFVPSEPIVPAGPGSPSSPAEQPAGAGDLDIGTSEIPSPDPAGSGAATGGSDSGDPYDFDSVDLGGSSQPQLAGTATQTEEVDSVAIETPDPPPPTHSIPPGGEFDVESDRIDLPLPADASPPPDGTTVPPAADEFSPSTPSTETGGEFVTGDALPPDDPRPEDGVFDIPAPEVDASPSDAESKPEDGVFDIPAPEVDASAEAPVDDAETPSESGVFDIPAAEPDEDASAGSSMETPSLPGDADEKPSEPSGPTEPLGEGEVWVPKEELPGGVESREDGDGGVVNMADLVSHFSAEVKSDVDADDYRSHYDLGMAYLEMELITEAIREFQFAANSSQYRTQSLELIGMCFIKQNQPKLAIKQLEKGLALIGGISRDSIGLQYNLGLAHEMLENADKAKQCFEEVYVLDVSFRDIAEKISKFS